MDNENAITRKEHNQSYGMKKVIPYGIDSNNNAVSISVNKNGDLKNGILSGASTNGTVALAVADTWYQVPTTAPTSDYVLVVSKENEAGTIRWSTTNSGTPSATNGNKFLTGSLKIKLAANEVIYFGSSTAGDDVNWITKII